MKLIDALNEHIENEDLYKQDSETYLFLSREIPQLETLLQSDIHGKLDLFEQFFPNTWTWGIGYILDGGLTLALYESKNYVPYVADDVANN